MQRTLIIVMLSLFWIAATPTGGYSADGAALFARCAGCHGADGTKPPNVLKGQSSAQVLGKMKGFLDGSYGGQRKEVMIGKLKTLSPEEMQSLADYIGSL